MILSKISVDITEINSEIYSEKTEDYWSYTLQWVDSCGDPSEVYSPTQYTEERTEVFEVVEGNDRMETL